MAVTRTPIVPNPGVVTVDARAGEFLHFVIDASGPMPIFSFASSVKGALRDAGSFPGHPLRKYEWDRLKIASEIQNLELLDLGLTFLTNATYTYTVELHGLAGLFNTAIKVVYSGTPMDTDGESFRVVIK